MLRCQVSAFRLDAYSVQVPKQSKEKARARFYDQPHVSHPSISQAQVSFRLKFPTHCNATRSTCESHALAEHVTLSGRAVRISSEVNRSRRIESNKSNKRRHDLEFPAKQNRQTKLAHHHHHPHLHLCINFLNPFCFTLFSPTTTPCPSHSLPPLDKANLHDRNAPTHRPPDLVFLVHHLMISNKLPRQAPPETCSCDATKTTTSES
ncbi:hypothetical protein BKA63DRAFT_183158 [Paraphoma chrysanthemicola]|nr:hypothetical protein BKA63DRAFT_183158 [Paraphoma chrysanthemicola]